jgi:hypothetical protein
MANYDIGTTGRYYFAAMYMAVPPYDQHSVRDASCPRDANTRSPLGDVESHVRCS